MSCWRWASASRRRWCMRMRGKEHVEWDNPYDVGMTGLIGFSSGYYAMLDCDVLLMLGTDFPIANSILRVAASASRRSISEPENIGRRARRRSRRRRRRPRDARGAAAAARSRSATARISPRRSSTTPGRARRSTISPSARPARRLIHPQQIAKAISDHAAEDAVFTCDVGLPTVWAARYLAMNGKRRLHRARSGTARWPMRWRRRSAPRPRFPAGR